MLGLALVGVVPLTALGTAVPIILTATSIGLFLATIWAAAVGQTAVASVFGVFLLVDVALILLFAGFNAIPTSTGLLRAAGWVILVFAAIGVYLYADCVSQATGGGAYPLGNPLLPRPRSRKGSVPAPRQG